MSDTLRLAIDDVNRLRDLLDVRDGEITRLRGQVEALNAERDRLWVEKLKTQVEVAILREENARLRVALKPFAERLDEIEKVKASKYACATSVEIEHLRAAAAAIRDGENKERQK